MNIRSSFVFAALTAFTLSHASAQETMKVGTVDMKRLFQEYYKTKDAEKKVNEDKTKAKKELDDRQEKFKALIDSWNKAQTTLKDKMVNESLKEETQKKAAGIASEAKALEREITEFTRRRETQLGEQVGRMRKGIFEDIRQRVEEKAKRDNYDLVFDKSGMGSSGLPILLHSRLTKDFSEEVLSELNKNAPKDASAAKGQ